MGVERGQDEGDLPSPWLRVERDRYDDGQEYASVSSSQVL